MDFKSRFKTKISHITKDGIVGVIAQNSQPITKFKVSNTNLHYMIFAKKNCELENKIQLDFTPSSSPVLKLNANPYKVFTKMDENTKNINFFTGSSKDIKIRDNYQKNSVKNFRSANETPISSLSPLYGENKKNEGLGMLPFLPALNRNEIVDKRIIFPQKNQEEVSNTAIIKNSPLLNKNNIRITVKNDEGYQSKWIRNKDGKKNRALVNSAERNLAGDSSFTQNEFIDDNLKNTNSNNFYNNKKNNQEGQKNLKNLEVEIGKVLTKLNEISETIKFPNYR